MKKSFRFRTLIIVLLFFSLIAYGIYQYFDKTKYIVEIDPGRLATVERSDIARSVVATGRIEPITKVEIKSKANGIIKELKVKVGDLVESNQVLAELDKENLIARVRESQAALMAAQSGLRASEAEYEKNKVEAENPEIVFVKRDFERAKKLFATGLILNKFMMNLKML
ncbi:MAG: efflux RND transporter periplasmic adaptor subunit [Blastocatellia bacterium]|nr:efflux RND transporter periplasmic adaptor subunit [Blastocatellia bacterium]